jgi:hypothetical protein
MSGALRAPMVTSTSGDCPLSLEQSTLKKIFAHPNKQKEELWVNQCRRGYEQISKDEAAGE